MNGLFCDIIIIIFLYAFIDFILNYIHICKTNGCQELCLTAPTVEAWQSSDLRSQPPTCLTGEFRKHTIPYEVNET